MEKENVSEYCQRPQGIVNVLYYQHTIYSVVSQGGNQIKMFLNTIHSFSVEAIPPMVTRKRNEVAYKNNGWKNEYPEQEEKKSLI